MTRAANDPDYLLNIARSCGLREAMHGVPPSVARGLLNAFVCALDSEREAGKIEERNHWKEAVLDSLAAWPGMDFTLDTEPRVILAAVLDMERKAAQALETPGDALARTVHLRGGRDGRVYIAGPMTGLPEFNFPAFNAKAAELRGFGWHVENPAEHGHVEGATWADYLRWDITRIATCGSIYLLPGWSASKGASLEVVIARALGMVILLDDEAEHVPETPSEDDLVKALAECRDAFPAPAPGTPLERQWAQAMSDPISVPDYVRAAALCANDEPMTEPFIVTGTGGHPAGARPAPRPALRTAPRYPNVRTFVARGLALVKQGRSR